MDIEGGRIFQWVKATARRANKFIIVSPFFSLDGEMKELLQSIPTLQVLVADEFATNNPSPLRQLSKEDSKDIRCIYRRELGNRLHAKVFYASESSGRRSALVGSANFTVSGLRRNTEQAVSFDSNYEIDRPMLRRIEDWIDDLQKYATDINWERAEKEFENSPNPNIPVDNFEAYRRDQIQNYWVLKTTEGSHGISRWREFVKERVISIGWNEVVAILRNEDGLGPTEYTRDSLNAAADRWGNGEHSHVTCRHAAKSLHWFSRKFSIGDRILLCRGYAANQLADVHLYGFAIVDGDVVDDATSDWWNLKRSAVLRRKEINIPRVIFANALQKNSLLHTIHRISSEEYEDFLHQMQGL